MGGITLWHFLIDTDTASDDAVALAMALNYPDVAVEAITIVAGNVPLKMGVQNALYTVGGPCGPRWETIPRQGLACVSCETAVACGGK